MLYISRRNRNKLRNLSYFDKLLLLSILCLSFTLLLVILSVRSGPVSINFAEILNILINILNSSESTIDMNSQIILNIRLPRIILAILVGISLSVSGAIMQGLLRNPMADPSIIGVSSGAAVGAVSSIALGRYSVSLIVLPLMAFLGGIIAAFTVYFISFVSGRNSLVSLILGGLAISLFANSVISMIILASSEYGEMSSILFWLAGGLESTRWDHVFLLFPIVLINLPILIFYSNKLNVLAISDDSAKSLGLNVSKTRLILLLSTTALTSMAVAVSGIIAFVGIIIPHIVRLITGPDNRVVIPISALLGSLFLVFTDYLARTIFSPTEIRLGIITSLVGAPFFIYLLIRQRTMEVVQ